MRLYKNGTFIEDSWRSLADDSPVEGPSIVSLKRWQELRDRREGDNLPVGVRLDAGEPIDLLVPDLERVALIALVFPKFNDGRSFSKASMLRGQYGFKGEIRAVGEVLWDQLQLMRRCGFDAFEVDNEPTIRALERGKKPFMDEFYQPGLEAEAPADPHRPWLRRAARA